MAMKIIAGDVEDIFPVRITANVLIANGIFVLVAHALVHAICQTAEPRNFNY